MADLVTLVKDKESRLSPLYDRMDSDMKLYYLEEFILKDSEGRKIPDADSITLNDSRTYADRVINLLSGAKRRFNVNGEAKLVKSVESFLDQVYKMNDESLAMQMMESLEFHLDFFSTLRGWIAVRALMLNSGDTIVPEIVPLDPRWCAWDAGRRGLNWGSYRIRMSPQRIEEEYGKAVEGTKDRDILCVWTDTDYIVYLENTELRKVPHNLGHCPIVVLPVPTHPSVISTSGDMIKYQGESVYAANRDIYAKLNDFASVWATLNKMSFLAPVGYVSPQGRELKERPYGIGVVVNLREGEKFVDIPTKDLSASAQNLFGVMMGNAQRGGLPNVDYGELGFELSAVAISKLTESRNVVFQPRLKGKSALLERASRLLIAQAINGGYKTELPKDTEGLEFDSKALEGKFQIDVDYHAISPEQNIANYTVAQVAKAIGLSDRTIFSEVLSLEDPEGEIKQREREYSEKEVPELRLYRYACSLLDAYEQTKDETLQVEAQIVASKLGMSIQGGKVVETQAPAQPASQPKAGVTMPTMTAAAGQPSGQPAAQQIVTTNMRRKGVTPQE